MEANRKFAVIPVNLFEKNVYETNFKILFHFNCMTRNHVSEQIMHKQQLTK